MKISILQLNIEGGRFLDAIILFVQILDIDILQFQEVSGGGYAKYTSKDVFAQLKNALHYKGVLTKRMRKLDDPNIYEGNAILFKPSFRLLSENVIWMKPFFAFSSFPITNEDNPHNALDLKLEKDNISFHCITTHMAWGPTPEDKPYKLKQGEILYDYLRNIPPPFIFSGDFNVTPDSQIVKQFDSLSRNLTREYNVMNTLNPRTHKVKHLFPAGLAVDFLYTSNDIRVYKFRLIEKDLSDHFGLYAEVDID